MSSEHEIEESIKLLKSFSTKLIVLHCLSEYPKEQKK